MQANDLMEDLHKELVDVVSGPNLLMKLRFEGEIRSNVDVVWEDCEICLLHPEEFGEDKLFSVLTCFVLVVRRFIGDNFGCLYQVGTFSFSILFSILFMYLFVFIN